MPQSAKNSPAIDPTAFLEEGVDEAIALRGGDARAALKSALVANSFLQAEIEKLAAAVSSGFARGRIRSAKNGRETNSHDGDQRQQTKPLPQLGAAPVGGGE